MSQENVEIVRAIAEAWNRDDFDAFIDLTDPEVEWQTAVERFFEGTDTVHRGHAGVREFWRSYKGGEFERLDIRLDEFRDLGEIVLALGEASIIGRTSQLELRSEVALVVTIRGGKVASSRDFLSHAEGLKAAGLRE
jgi:ketosteroid isomerase-like protein